MTVDLPSETGTFHCFRKCLAYLFLYLKAVIRWLLTRQLVLLQIINLSLPALSFAVWHSPRLIMSAKNKKLEWKSPCKPLHHTFVTFMFLTPGSYCGDISNSFLFESPHCIYFPECRVIWCYFMLRWNTDSISRDNCWEEQKIHIYLTVPNFHCGCAELEDLLISQKDSLIM